MGKYIELYKEVKQCPNHSLPNCIHKGDPAQQWRAWTLNPVPPLTRCNITGSHFPHLWMDHFVRVKWVNTWKADSALSCASWALDTCYLWETANSKESRNHDPSWVLFLFLVFHLENLVFCGLIITVMAGQQTWICVLWKYLLPRHSSLMVKSNLLVKY